jgi:hypothetical protein
MGFGSTNDLSRHIRAKHPSAMWYTEKYSCIFPGCKSKKVWLRLDNFRTHIRGVHRVTLSKNSAEIQMQVGPMNNMYLKN